MWDWIIHIDKEFFLLLNGMNHPFFDSFFSLFGSKEFWVPFYLVLLFVIIKQHRAQAVLIIVALILTITLSDQFSNFLKINIARLRPSHDPSLDGLVHNTFLGQGGNFGFVSAHAANAFALTVFVAKLSKSKSIALIMLVWALFTAYSRIYVGVHFPLDVVCGGIMGALLGWSVFKILIFSDTRFFKKEIAKNGVWNLNQIRLIGWSLTFMWMVLLIFSYLMVKHEIVI